MAQTMLAFLVPSAPNLNWQFTEPEDMDVPFFLVLRTGYSD
jgi:hypothetical protein